MSSPLGPISDNLFLVYNKPKWLENCPLHFKPMFHRRFVDDIFLMSDKIDLVKNFSKYMNTRHCNIKYHFLTFRLLTL